MGLKFNFSGKQPDYQPVLSGYQGTLDRWAKANLSGNYSDELATVRPMEAGERPGQRAFMRRMTSSAN